ncbi:MAG: redox-sensing transcriptional repressor Rex [Phycisphaerales bacterium]|nr:redox-sensing transcriptional repressor Rex [Phycisphaerales bacterium]
MAKSEGIPAPAVRRLSLYLRHLETTQARNHATVSSRELSRAVGVTDAQVRKDLAYFGQFGHPGIGYRVDELIARMRQILGADQVRRVILVGAGNLGRALMSYRGFRKKNFDLVAVFDNDATKIGLPTPELPGERIRSLDDLPRIVAEHDVRLAVIAVPAQAAQAVADQLAAAGVRGLLNFAPMILQTRPGITLSSVDLAVQLEQLAFQVNLGAEGAKISVDS